MSFPVKPQPSPFSESGQVVTPDRWWLSFDEGGLDQQINQAFTGSFTLAAAAERLRAARAVTRREASDLWPDVDGVADIGSVLGPGRDRTSYTLGLDASYQVDLWGQIESRVQAERLRAQATYADYHAVALTLTADIARTWFALIESRAQLELLDEQIETNQKGATLQAARFGLGQSRGADVLRQRQLVESTREQAVIVKAQVEVLEHQLAVLLGQPPQAASYTTGAQLPELPDLPAAGLPSELLHRRPDVRSDYLAFMAADRDLASAITAQYPRINLTGSLLNLADRPEDLFRDWFVSIGAQLIGPLIDGGERRAEVDRTQAVARQRYNEYGETMLNAFREVEDSLALERYQLERIGYLEKQVELARQASEQLREQYLIGDTDYLNVLSAITTQQRLQRDMLSARLELLLIRINLYLALAGDFVPCQQDLLGIQSDPLLLEEPPTEPATATPLTDEPAGMDFPAETISLPAPPALSKTDPMAAPDSIAESEPVLRQAQDSVGINVDE
ncbi:MAG: TolC family protein [Rubripirellula sp.]